MRRGAPFQQFCNFVVTNAYFSVLGTFGMLNSFCTKCNTQTVTRMRPGDNYTQLRMPMSKIPAAHEFWGAS